MCRELIPHDHLQGLIAPLGEIGHIFFPSLMAGEITTAIPGGAEIICIRFAYISLGDRQQIANGRRAFVRGLRHDRVNFVSGMSGASVVNSCTLPLGSTIASPMMPLGLSSGCQ